MAKQREANSDMRAYVLVAGRAYPSARRYTEVKRGHETTSGKPAPPLTPQRFFWIGVAKDR